MASSIVADRAIHGADAPPEVSGAELRSWLKEVQYVDEQTQGFLQRAPAAACPRTCSQCCQHAAPLVSDVEFALIRSKFKHMEPDLREGVEGRARAIRADLEQGAGDDFACPLLVDGRCLVYSARPYLCRSFGHSVRRVDDRVQIFSCERLLPAMKTSMPPLLDFRITALRRVVGRVIDSYLPIWLSTKAEHRRVAWPQKDRAVMVAREEARVEEAQSP